MVIVWGGATAASGVVPVARDPGPRDPFRCMDHIPPGAIRAFHIHALHRTPAMENPIPWADVFLAIRRLDRPVLINPEVHHLVQVGPTIQFCRDLLAVG